MIWNLKDIRRRIRAIVFGKGVRSWFYLAAVCFLFSLIQNVVLLGRHRYVLENRMQQNVSFQRLLAPFHKATLWIFHSAVAQSGGGAYATRTSEDSKAQTAALVESLGLKDAPAEEVVQTLKGFSF